MAKRIYTTVRRKDGEWGVRSGGASGTTSVYSTKSEAWKETRRLARGSGSVAVLLGKDGKITAQNTYNTIESPPENK